MDFFGDFAVHGLDVERPEEVLILRRNVPADTDRAFAMEPSFSLQFASLVVKQLAPMPEQTIGNQLLEARVDLHLVARPEADIRRIEERFKVRINLGAEPLEVPDLAKQERGDDKYVFDLLTDSHS